MTTGNEILFWLYFRDYLKRNLSNENFRRSQCHIDHICVPVHWVHALRWTSRLFLVGNQRNVCKALHGVRSKSCERFTEPCNIKNHTLNPTEIHTVKIHPTKVHSFVVDILGVSNGFLRSIHRHSPALHHYIDVIMATMASQITSLRLFTQPFIQTQIKENTKAPRHWPFYGEFTGTGEFPAQRASKAENVSIWWRHHVHWNWGTVAMCQHVNQKDYA